MQLMTVSPPYIRFETRAIKQFKTAEEGGTVFFKDVDYALVTSHGSKDTVEKALPEWFTQLENEVRQDRLPGNWLEAYKRSYEKWKAGEELPVIGTPIKNWPVLSPAEAKMLNELGIRAVEDLANANEELIARIGMGARSLVQRAKDWVTSYSGQAPLVQALDAERAVRAGLEHRLRELEAVVAGFAAQQKAASAAKIDEVHLPSAEEQLARLPRQDDLDVGAMIDEEIS
jgi:hypothetical protein